VKNSDSNQHVIVIGNSADRFIQHVINLLVEYDAKVVLCEDVYQAVGQWTRNGFSTVLLVGRLEHLNRENGRFFQKAKENCHTCCCFVEGLLARRQKQISAIEEVGGFIINEPAGFEHVLEKWLASGGLQPQVKKANSCSSGFFKDEFLTTKAELDALIGV